MGTHWPRPWFWHDGGQIVAQRFNNLFRRLPLFPSLRVAPQQIRQSTARNGFGPVTLIRITGAFGQRHEPPVQLLDRESNRRFREGRFLFDERRLAMGSLDNFMTLARDELGVAESNISEVFGHDPSS